MSAPTDVSKYRFNHTMYRVKDAEASIKFYTEVLGMTLLGKMDNPDAKFTLYFLGYQQGPNYKPDDSLSLKSPVFGREGILELTHNWGTENDANFKGYHNGNDEPQGYGHIAIAVDNLDAACKRMTDMGVRFKKRPEDGRMRNIAFIYDPDNYWIELVVHPGV
ncbi:Lactoylglutathione lyase [Dimargaris verticillata]|uniref:Lactoylglutathione lyase n=1 Tax=Dimargaris verticillata TaxID=2761393 RepID=A0A9W8B2K9_9FUNG|nr:Lactoylglutathione lyase [Dimargaris verticillata]